MPKRADRARASTPASEAVSAEWLARVEAEYRSAALTQHLGLWLIQCGAPPHLIEAAMRIAADEMAHADLSHRTYAAAGGRQPPRIERQTLELQRHEADPLEYDVTRVCVDVFCLGETVAVPLFARLRAGCTVGAARRALDRVLRDEVRHRDFGWKAAGFLLDEHPMGAELRRLVERELPTWFARVRAVYAPPGAERLRAIPPEDRAWGLMAPASYAAVLNRTLERDWVPRFSKLGFDARAAFTAATS